MVRDLGNGPQLGPWLVESFSSSLSALWLLSMVGGAVLLPSPCYRIAEHCPGFQLQAMEGNSGVSSRPETTLNTR